MTAQASVSYHVEAHRTEERPRRFLEALAAILKHSNYGPVLDFYTRVTAKCSRCAAACQVYEASSDPRDIPCNRSELLFRVYRRYFTVAGQLKARLYDDFVLTDGYLDTMAEEFWRCTACRRCKASCPMGIDHGMITHLARWALAEIDVIPKAMVVSVREQLEGETKNTSAIPVEAIKDSCEFLEEELEELYPGKGIKFPMDVEGADYVFFAPVSDYLMEADTLMGNAAMLRASNTSWTIGTSNADGINYGLFYSDRMWERILKAQVAEIKRLKGKEMLIGECGHASRAAIDGMQNYIPPEDRVPVRLILDLAYEKFVSGELKLKENAIKERTTYHDPCNIVRKGWVVDQPRAILRHICEDFVEMTPNRGENYCCGGGGGTVSMDELHDFRMSIGGKTKAEQLKRTGAHYVVTPCANCKKQVDEIIAAHELDMEKVGLHDLLLKAIDFGPENTPEPTPENTEGG
jgi:Fe-S oxidoreductase